MDALLKAVSTIPAGAWLVGVSGGADSVALLHLLREQAHLRLVVAHLDHQLRGEESAGDARFVRELCERLGIECMIARRDDIEQDLNLPANRAAQLRRLRFEFFRRAIESHGLQGVVLAHHADDQAETVLQRLLRGASYASLTGIAPRATVHGVVTLHPLLDVRRDQLRAFMTECGETWREDSSNRSDRYLRNRLRAVLRDRPELTETLLGVSRVCTALREWVRANAPKLDEAFAIGALDDAPAILARQAAARWLRERGVPAAGVDRAVVDRLREMCSDAASSPRRQFPGGITARRSRGIISALPGA